MHEVERRRWQSAQSLARLLPRIQQTFQAAGGSDEHWVQFEARLRREWDRLFQLLILLYGQQYDFFYHLEELLHAVARSWRERPAWLKELDATREAEPEWFQSQTMIGAMLYVDLFSGTLSKLHDYIPYFKELGLTYLHLMPLFDAPAGNSDGGYAVSNYREVSARIGTMEELTSLAEALHDQGISLVLDFVFNHTSDEHTWAKRAQAGDPEYQEFYYLFADRTMPDAYDRTLREIFPTVRRGSFTYHEGMDRWVWTTFNSFQWDLNYSNPAVFRAMAEEMLFIANAGVEFLRLDAVAFIWKRLGTSSENLPEAHMIIQAYNALARIAAPALLFKSEAIVHPDAVMKYIGVHECQISYNPLLMALLWEALATRDVKLLAHSMRTRFQLSPGTAWVNYLRSHDDIGWTFDDADAQHLWIDPFGHRQFLNAFYTGRFAGSFARGIPFQENPDTGDARVSGTLASLSGLEHALQVGDVGSIDQAIRRILLLHSIILSIGGIPLIYLGDELGTINDYAYITDSAKADDSRWVHRPSRNAPAMEQRYNPATAAGQLFGGLTRLIRLRKAQRALCDGDMEVIVTGNPHVFGYVRQHGGERLLVIANFSEHSQFIEGNVLRIYGPGTHFTDLISNATVVVDGVLTVGPYQYFWLQTRQQNINVALGGFV